MPKQWTPEERAEHGLKIAETKRKNREMVNLQRPAIAYPNPASGLELLPRAEPRPLTWYDLPKDAIKCARNPLVPRDAAVHKSQCFNCRNEMWTRDDKLENICEVCEYLLVNEKHRLRQERERKRGGVMNNPFKVDNSGGAVINPFATGRRLL